MRTIRNGILTFLGILLISNLSAQSIHEDYFFSKTTSGNFDSIVEKVVSEFKTAGFGVITQIDMVKTLKEKVDADILSYEIIGVCNPIFAYKALQLEPDAGVFLPCKVVVRQLAGGQIRIVSSNPFILMQMFQNNDLDELTEKVAEKIVWVMNQI